MIIKIVDQSSGRLLFQGNSYVHFYIQETAKNQSEAYYISPWGKNYLKFFFFKEILPIFAYSPFLLFSIENIVTPSFFRMDRSSHI